MEIVMIKKKNYKIKIEIMLKKLKKIQKKIDNELK